MKRQYNQAFKSSTNSGTPAKRARPSLQRQQRMPLALADEKKNVDLAGPLLTSAQATATVLHLNPIAPGAGPTQRLGRRVTMTSFNYRFTVDFTGGDSTAIRFLVVYDKQTNAAAPTAGAILVLDSLESDMNLSNSRRFKIICDEIVPCIGASGPTSCYVKGFRDFTNKGRTRGLDVEFNTGTAGTIADITTGSLIALTYQNGTWGTGGFNLLYTRVRFIDP